VGSPVFGKGLIYPRVGREPGRLQACLDHAQSAEGKDGAFERLVGLQPDDHLVVLVDVAGFVRQHRRGRLRIDGEYAFLPFLLEVGLKLVPHGLGAFGGPGEKRLVSGIGRDVANNEIAHVNAGTPTSGFERAPATLVLEIFGESGGPFHSTSPCASRPERALGPGVCAHPFTRAC